MFEKLKKINGPHLNPMIERFIRSIKSECLNRMLIFGEQHLEYLVKEYMEHYHQERQHQGLDNGIIETPPPRHRRNCLPGATWRVFEVLWEGRMRCKMTKFTLLRRPLLVLGRGLEEMGNKIGSVSPLESLAPAKVPAKLALSVYVWSTACVISLLFSVINHFL